MNKILIAIVVVLVLAVGGYFVFVDQNETQETTNTNTTTNTTNNNESNGSAQNNTPTIPSNWVKYESSELKLSFSFPPLPTGTTKYSFNSYPKRNTDPTGTIYSWEVKRTDIDSKGYTYSFAGGGSKDLKLGRSCWITDAHSFEERSGKFYLDWCTLMEITSKKVINHTSGTKAVVFDWDVTAYEGFAPRKSFQAATLNFPANYHGELGGITFLFYDQTSMADIEKVIQSVRFSK